MKVPDNTKDVQQITWVGIWVNLFLSIAKIGAGILGSSRALIADGLESTMDIFTSFALVLGAKYWNAPPDHDHPYGHRRIETTISLGIGLIVAAVGIGVLVSSILAIRHGETSNPTWIAFVVAVISVLSKEILFQWTVRKGKKVKSMAVVANAWHHRTDAISSVPVVFAVAGAQWLPAWGFLDSIGAIAASGFILKGAVEIIWSALREMIDTGASQDTLDQIEQIACSVEGVNSIHALRTRYVGSGIHVDLHIVLEPDITLAHAHQIGDDVVDRLKADGPDVMDVLVHLDPRDDSEPAESA